MAYTPQTWTNAPSTSTPISAARLGVIEAGIQAAAAVADAALSTTAAPELIRDTMGAALVAGTNVTITPNDAGDFITITASGSGGGFVDPLEFGSLVAVIGASTARRAYAAQTLTGARMRAATAPVGSSLIAQIQHSTDDTTYTTIGTLTMTTGSRVEQSTTFTQTQSVGHFLRVNITSVGSTTAATGVAVDVTRTVP